MTVPRPGMWTVPRIWSPGTECFVLGGGPSLKLLDMDRLRDRAARVIAVNMAYLVAPWSEVLFYGDSHWPSKFGFTSRRLHKGLRVTVEPTHLSRKDTKVVFKDNSEGISTEPDRLNWNRSSGTCAIGLARHLGATRIRLVGFDMCQVDKATLRDHGIEVPDKDAPDEVTTTHFHNRYIEIATKINKKRKLRRNDPYPAFRSAFPRIRTDLDAEGIEILNLCPWSAIEDIERVHPKELGLCE